MLSIFGGGFDALWTTTMSQGDNKSVEESKLPDPSLVDAGDRGGNDPHGDTGRGGITQAVMQTQRNDNDARDCNAEILNHILVHILDKEQVDASATNDFTVFVIANGIDDVRLLLTVSEDDFNSMGCNVNFKTIRTLQAINKMYNKQILDTTSKNDKNVWFLNLGK